ncbi:MAG: NAD(P)-dependent glycerol-3-phosphate dehydrogenase [Bacteroidetes bacterium]|nr:NAD(P)-dependent glycerol-3-phosphate dehydrogenase [Bacteroidota bacterium]
MNIGILGAGSWGTTLAEHLHQLNHSVTLWSWSKRDVENMRITGRNTVYMPEIAIPEKMVVTGDIGEATAGMDMLVIATPSQFVRSVLTRIPTGQLNSPYIVNVAKGIEKDSLLRMSEVVRDTLPQLPAARYAVLSGPSHAEEVCKRRPTTVVAASSDTETISIVIDTFMSGSFRVYASNDVTGVELGGALKNIIAIGAGICDGSRFGDNAKAALITRGLAEIRRLGVELGADPHTFAGLSGLGDLIVTTMSQLSRNRFVGQEIGKGRPVKEVLDSMSMVAEGVDTARAAYELSRKHDVEMPIIRQMYEILFNEKDPVQATQDLMTREAKNELWS